MLVGRLFVENVCACGREVEVQDTSLAGKMKWLVDDRQKGEEGVRRGEEQVEDAEKTNTILAIHIPPFLLQLLQPGYKIVHTVICKLVELIDGYGFGS